MIQSVISSLTSEIFLTPLINCAFCGPCSLFLSSEKCKDKGHLSHFPIGLKPQQCLLDHAKLKYEHNCLEL